MTWRTCCHPIPGDRIVGLRREDEGIEVHVIGCDKLASGIDADWLDLAWGDGSDGGTARLWVILRDVAGRARRMAGHPGRQGGQHRQPASPTATAASTPSTSTSRSTTSPTCTA